MWRYEPPVAEVVQALKFSDRADLASPLGTMLADRVRSEDLVLDDVVPVPLHWRRRLARGYDQAEAIARNVADRLGLVMTRALRRVRSTRPQSRLERRERPLNVRSAFQTRRGVSVEGRRILLVDDVVTSAATLHSAATALSRRGAGPVVGAVIARTPKPGGGPPQASSARHRTSGRRFL